MATVATESPVPSHAQYGECRHISWTLTNGQTGDAVQFTEFFDKCVQFSGTFGAGGTIRLEGSNELTNPSTFHVLTDVNGNTISVTAAGLYQAVETPMWIRPSVTAGDGTTSITAQIVARRGRERSY